MDFSAKQIADFLQGEIVGDENVQVNTFAKIEEGVVGAISFLSNPKYNSYLYTTKSSIVLINKDLNIEKNVLPTLIKVDNAYESIAKLLTLYNSFKQKPSGISSLASIADSASIGSNVYIAPFVVVGEHASIGDGAKIYPHVTIGNYCSIGQETIINSNCSIYDECKVGNHCIVHSGCVIGADGFGFAPTSDGYEKIPQIGNVVIEDNVEIGANTCIDRSTMGSTIIRKGTKLDNLVQIAHNVEIGENSVLAAQCGIAGSTKIGDWCMLGGQAGIVGHLHIGSHSQLGAQTGVTHNLPEKSVCTGTPTMEVKSYLKSSAIFRKLPDMYAEINALRKELETLKDKINNQSQK